MDGLELRKEINENEFLRKKSIPFIFLTTTSNRTVIEQAYEMMVQGYFVKPNSIQEIKETIKMIIDYWKVCRHPNTEI
jgi:CheY-like chemotaxis protein